MPKRVSGCLMTFKNAATAQTPVMWRPPSQLCESLPDSRVKSVSVAAVQSRLFNRQWNILLPSKEQHRLSLLSPQVLRLSSLLSMDALQPLVKAPHASLIQPALQGREECDLRGFEDVPRRPEKGTREGSRRSGSERRGAGAHVKRCSRSKLLILLTRGVFPE